jgi:hypothetical protein
LGIQFKHEETNIEFLSHEELETLIHKEFSIQRLEQVRDIFVFCSFTGLAFVDVQQLTPNHLVKDNNGAMWIRKSRQKTGNMCNIPVLSVAQRLIEKYQDHPDCIRKGVILPVIIHFMVDPGIRQSSIIPVGLQCSFRDFQHHADFLIIQPFP